MAKKTFIAGEDLTGKAGYALKAENGKVKLAGVKGEACLGILSNDNIADKAVAVALPGEVCKVKLIEIDGKNAVGESMGMQRKLRVDFIPEPKIGDYVIVHAGFAIERLPEEQALEDIAAWEEIRDVL